MPAYADRTAVAHDIPPEHLDARSNALFMNTIVLGGQVIGTWQRTLNAKSVAVTLRPFHKLSKSESATVHQAAQCYAEFMDFEQALIDYPKSRLR